MSNDRYVILPLKEEDARKLGSSHGAYPSDNVISMRAVAFRKKCAEFLRIAFGEREEPK